MRVVAAFPALVLLWAGCSGPALEPPCNGSDHVFYLSSGGLVAKPPGPGSVAIGDATEAFATDDLRPFLSAPRATGLLLEGNVTLELWVETRGAPSPLVVGPNATGYHLFNQFGSDRALQPAYAVEFADAVSAPGTVHHFVETLEMPPGGFVVERGDRVRVLLTSLATAGPTATGHHVLVGGETPSQVRFAASCHDERHWRGVEAMTHAVELPAHGGLFTGAIPPTEGINLRTVPFQLLAETDRLTVALRQSTAEEPKNDLDLVIVDATGAQVWMAGSPYADETAVLWEGNLEALMPPGAYGVQVHSYSGTAYTGSLRITQERA